MSQYLPTLELREDPGETAAVARELMRLTRELIKLGARHVVLFGSRARGQERAGSDSDLLVVMPCPAAESYPGRLARIASRVCPRTAVDLIVYTPEEFERLRLTRRFVQQAITEGVVLHEG